MVGRTLVTLSLAQAAQVTPEDHQVPHLPGWDGEPLSKIFAGHISAGADGNITMYEHYLFFESEGDPKTDPIIMWTNGGPGASSFFGAFTELGPYYVSDASLSTEAYRKTSVPTLFKNPHRWTRLASLLVRNLPPPIGYSYCDPAGPMGDGYSCGDWDDTRMAKHSYEFMKNWREAFPAYAKLDLYLIGESYAGLYVPMLAREILRDESSGLAQQLKGIAIGDGCIGGADGHGGCAPNKGPFFEVEFFHGHGQFSARTYAEIQASCGPELLAGVTSPACRAALDKMDEEKGYSFAYNLYDECYDPDLLSSAWHTERSRWGPWHAGDDDVDEHGMDGFPCGGSVVMPKWAKTPEVQEALHVHKGAPFFFGDNGVGFNYNVSEPSLIPWYREVLKADKLRVLIYNGDADPAINSFFAENWTAEVGLTAKEPWRPWTRDGDRLMGGFVTRYEHGLDFLTIRGAGHMVPEYKPEASFTFLKAWLNNADYPRLSMPSRPAVV